MLSINKLRIMCKYLSCVFELVLLTIFWCLKSGQFFRYFLPRGHTTLRLKIKVTGFNFFLEFFA